MVIGGLVFHDCNMVSIPPSSAGRLGADGLPRRRTLQIVKNFAGFVADFVWDLGEGARCYVFKKATASYMYQAPERFFHDPFSRWG